MYLHRLIFFLASVWCVSSEDWCSSSNYSAVYSALFDKLNLLGNNTLLTLIRPTSDKNQATRLYTALYVTSITDVNEKAQSISTQVRLLIPVLSVSRSVTCCCWRQAKTRRGNPTEGTFNEDNKDQEHPQHSYTCIKQETTTTTIHDINTLTLTKTNWEDRNIGAIYTRDNKRINKTHVMIMRLIGDENYGVCSPWEIVQYWRKGSSWSSSEFCGIKTFATKKNLIWTPDIAVLESIKTDYASHDSPNVLLYSSGYVDMVDILSLTTVCKMDMYMFPFDTQTCSITLRSLMHTDNQLVFAKTTSAEHLTIESQKIFQTQGEWELIEMETTIDKSNDLWLSQSRMIFQITIKRRPLLYIINLIFPVFCFLVLDVSSFFIKASQSEKLGFKVTLLLSISVLLLILNDKLPSTSSRIPLIGIYCGGVFTLIGISILETVFVNVLIAKGEKLKLQPPEETKPAAAAQDEPNGLDIRPDIPLHDNDVAWWNVLGSVFVNVMIVKEEEETKPEKTEETRTAPTAQDEDVGDFNSPETVTSTTEEQTSSFKTRNKASRCWTRAARIIDAIFFVIYIITIVVFLSLLGKVWFVF